MIRNSPKTQETPLLPNPTDFIEYILMISALMGFAPKDVPYLAKPFTAQQYRSFLGELVA